MEMKKPEPSAAKRDGNTKRSRGVKVVCSNILMRPFSFDQPGTMRPDSWADLFKQCCELAARESNARQKAETP